MNIIQIIKNDNEGIEKCFYDGIEVDMYGIVKIHTTTEPLFAKTFSIVDTENKNSIFKIVVNAFKGCSVSVKTLNLTIE